MLLVLERMGNAILATLSAAWTFVWTWVRGLSWDVLRWNVFRWDILGLGVLLVLLATVLLLRRRRAPAPKSAFPDLNVSLGSIMVHAPAHPGVSGPGVSGPGVYRADNRIDTRVDTRTDYRESREGGVTTETAPEAAVPLTLPTELNMTVSNASPYSVQLLEVALETEAMARPATLSVTRLLLADSAVRLKERLPALRGSEGRLSLSFYAAATPDKYFRLQALFYQEAPDRYTISPLEQTIKPATFSGDKDADGAPKRLQRRATRKREVSTAEREERQRLEFPDEF